MKRIVLIVLVVFLLLPTVASAAPLEWTILGYHTVRTGETLFCIARAYGVDPWAIASQNGILHPNWIYPGRVLAIPAVYMTLPTGPVCTPQFGGTPPGPCTRYHTVVSGDTLYRIALLYGVSMWRIAECNHIVNLNYIWAGDTLCIPTP